MATRFYHFERRKPNAVLQGVLADALSRGERAAAQFADAAALAKADEELWTLDAASFLPHGGAGDADPEGQPIYLTIGAEAPNGATLRVLMPGVDPAAALAAPGAPTLVVLFDGADPTAREEARAQWSALKAAGVELSYWREGEAGWAQLR